MPKIARKQLYKALWTTVHSSAESNTNRYPTKKFRKKTRKKQTSKRNGFSFSLMNHSDVSPLLISLSICNAYFRHFHQGFRYRPALYAFPSSSTYMFVFFLCIRILLMPANGSCVLQLSLLLPKHNKWLPISHMHQIIWSIFIYAVWRRVREKESEGER